MNTYSRMEVVKVCCIPDCPSNVTGNKSTLKSTAIQFYPFPNDPILKEMWMERVRKAGNGNRWYPTTSSRLCGIHFSSTGKKEACDILPRYFGSKVYSHSGVNAMDEVEVKIEVEDDDDIEIHDDPLAEESLEFTNTDVKQEPQDLEDNSSGIPKTKSREDNQSTSMSPSQFSSLMPSLAKIEEKINLIKRNTHSDDVTESPKKKRLIKLTQMLGDDHNLEIENAALKHQIAILEQSLEKSNNMIKERKEIIMNLVKEINKLKQQTCSFHELTRENEHLQQSLVAANRRINEEKELIVNLTIENINLKKVAEATKIGAHDEHECERKLKQQTKLTDALRDKTRSLKEEIKCLTEEFNKLENKCSVLDGYKTRNLIMQTSLTKQKQKLALYKEELETCKASLRNQEDRSDSEIKYYTGFQGKSEFRAFCKIAKAIDPTPVSESYNISKIRQQIFLTLSRIRRGLSIEDLSHRYNMSQGTVLRVLNHWQSILSDSSFNWKVCHSNSVIVKFFYEYFQEKNKRKVMCYFVGISPFGYVIFVSDLFLPSVNRTEMLKSSGILSLLDEGFTIGALDTNQFADIGIELFDTKPEEETDFYAHLNKLLLNVRKNKLFSHVLAFKEFSDINVSNAWKISWYLQNYIDEP